MTKHKRIYIIGFMGSGKTTTGKKLAAALKWSFIDLDLEIERSQGKSISDIFSLSGEPLFRQIESETLHNLHIEEDTVISVGGGTPCFCGNMDFMKQNGLVLYLRMTPGQLKSRLSGGTGDRPLLQGLSGEKILDFITAKLSEREIVYNQASLIVDSIDLSIKSLVEEIRIKSRISSVS
jgi:shikimate kinase